MRTHTTTDIASIIHLALRVADSEGQIPLVFETLSSQNDQLIPATSEQVDNNAFWLPTSAGQSFRITVHQD